MVEYWVVMMAATKVGLKVVNWVVMWVVKLFGKWVVWKAAQLAE